MDSLIRFPLIALLVLIAVFTTFAFASSQTGAIAGGEGTKLVSGYDVSGVHYQLAKDGAALASLEFDLNASAEVVKASLNSSGGFFACSNNGGYHWICKINSSVKVSEVSELKVVAMGK